MKRSALHVILLIAFVDLVGFGLIIPLQASYAERMGASGWTFGLLIGVYAAMQFVFTPLLGRWSDRVGRRRVLLISIAGSVLSHTLLGVADLASSLPLLFVARALDGVTGANIATAQAYIADVTTPENRAKGMGLFGAAFGLGFVLGPAIGAGLSALGKNVSGPAFGTAWPAFGAAVIAAGALLLVWRYLPEPKRSEARDLEPARVFSFNTLRAALARPRLRELLLLMFTSTFAFVLLEATFVYLCAKSMHLTETGTGLIFAYIGVIMVIVQGGLIGRLVPTFGEMRLVTVAPIITALGFMIISFVPMAAGNSGGALGEGVGSGMGLAWILLFVGCVPTSLGHGLTGPNLNALISRQADTGRQGMTLGLSQGIGSLARAIGPPIGGLLYDLRPALPYWTGAAVLVVASAFAVRIAPTQRAALARVDGLR